MGVKSTVTLTRSEAEGRYREATSKIAADDIRRRIGLELPDTTETLVPWHLLGRGITADEAVDVYVHIEIARRRPDLDAHARLRLSQLDDEGLETLLETVNDEANGGEGFENYVIRSAQ